MYLADELKARLGKPFDAGNLLGSGVKGWKETPWGKRARAPLGEDKFMLWDCFSLGSLDDVLDLSKANSCMAIQPSRGQKAKETWFVVRSCAKHSNDFATTPFEDIFPVRSETELVQASPMLLIVDDASYLEQRGPDWEKIESMMAQGWIITLVHGDHRFPNFAFVVLEKAAQTV